jgi:hypothetical protein
LNISISDANGLSTYNNISVSEGKELQFGHPGTSEIIFTSNGKDAVKLNFKDANGSSGVWLNGFELMEQ